MHDQIEQELREALSHQASQLDPSSIARLQAIDYRPARRRVRRLPAFGALGVTGVAAAVATIVSLGAGASPAFAGWQATPTTPSPAQLTQAAQACGQGLGSAVITDSRGPYTTSIYADSTTTDLCLDGNGVSLSSSSTVPTTTTVAAGQIQIGGAGTKDSAGNALTLVDGRVGTGVTAVTIERGDGSSVQATVSDGWYLAWWPGSVTPTRADITTASGGSSIAFPASPGPALPQCLVGSHCSTGYSYGGGPSSSSNPSGSLTSSTSSARFTSSQ